jgi:hypothetical protein
MFSQGVMICCVPRFVPADWKTTNRPVALIEGCTRLSPLAAEPSRPLLTSCTTVAFTAAEDKIANGTAFETAPVLVSFTKTDAVPGFATRAAGTAAYKIPLV